MFTSPEMPAPPLTTKAPVVVFELAVPLPATILPLAVNVVNAPVAGVFAPIGVLSKYPPVKITLPELTFVNCPSVAYTLAKPSK